MSSISVLNLNIMHGRNRKSAIFPLKVAREKVQFNLKKIADLIREQNPEIVTLQEVDEFSMLSGRFNQLDFLAANLDYPYKYFAPSCSVTLLGRGIYISGNAIFSKYELINCQSFCFDFSFPVDRMGFVVADAKVSDTETITIVSVHLVPYDWIRYKSREHELKQVEKALIGKLNPMIISGDMNCNVLDKEDSLSSFVSRLGLKVFEPENEALNTHPSRKPSKRIDWILPTKEIRIASYSTLPNQVSDHLAIIANFTI